VTDPVLVPAVLAWGLSDPRNEPWYEFSVEAVADTLHLPLDEVIRVAREDPRFAYDPNLRIISLAGPIPHGR
jgi:hypothetical protein